MSDPQTTGRDRSPHPADARIAEGRGAYRDARRSLTRLAARLRALSDAPHGAHVPRERMEAHLTGLRALLGWGEPFARCPLCDGEGCDECRGRGWLPRALHERAKRGRGRR